jgi:hypothetical protein
MTVNIVRGGSDEHRTQALLGALAVLRKEETELMSEFTAVKARLEAVRTVIAPMLVLLGQKTDQASDESAAQGLFDEEGGQAASGPLGELPFTQALKLFMDTQSEPLSVKDITNGFKAAGWKFKSESFADQANQVGVSLRRASDKFFTRTPEGKWLAKREPLPPGSLVEAVKRISQPWRQASGPNQQAQSKN